HIDLNLTESLHSVRMKWNRSVPANCADFGHRLDRSDLVVGRHDRYECGFLAYSPGDIDRMHKPLGVHRDQLNIEFLLAHHFHGRKNGAVLDGRYQDMLAVRAGGC